MAFDGVFLSGICRELAGHLQGGRVDKISQPDSTTIIVAIRSNSVNYQLLLSVHPNFGRVHLTTAKKTNPSHPPLFCMVLRKHLVGGKVISISQSNLERVINIKFSCYNELGDLEEKSLIAEIMGKHSNLILLGQNDQIIDSIKRIGHSVSRFREVLPNRPYLAPPDQHKLEIATVTEELVAEEITNAPEQTKLTNLLVNRFQGISPLLAKELVFQGRLSLATVTDSCGLREVQLIFQSLSKLAEIINTGSYTPCIAFTKKVPVAFSALNLSHLSGSELTFPASVNETADAFFQAKESLNLFNQVQANLVQKITTDIEKLHAKLAIQQDELKAAQKCEEDKIKGQLITANLYQISHGQESVSVINYFAENAPTVTIELDSSLPPNANAQAYFKRYAKSKKAMEVLTKQIALGQEELAYLESIITAVKQAKALAELDEIKLELIQENYLSQLKPTAKKKPAVPSSTPHEFVSTDGYTILVGKNNNQNDKLTLKTGKDDDIWLHVKKIPGSHVLIKANGRPVPEATINQAALLAAYFSKARHSNQVPVDYTYKKYVKKPGGAKPGMVIYTNEKTIYTKAKDPWLTALGLED